MQRHGMHILIGAWTCAAAGLAAVNASLSGGTLSVTADAGDFITITSDSGRVLVSGSDVGAATDVERIEINGSPNDDIISLTTVSANDFPNLTSVDIDGGGGSDSIVGSQLIDDVIDRDGGDEFLRSPGADRYTVGLDADGGVTTFLDTQGSNSLHIVGRSANEIYAIGPDMVEVGAARVVLDATPSVLTIIGGGGRDTFVAFTPLGFDLEVTGANADDYLAIDTAGAAVVENTSSFDVGADRIAYVSVAARSTCDFADFVADDCNGNQVPDGCEVATEVADDDDGDGVLDACEDPDDGGSGDGGSGGGGDPGDGGGSGGNGGGSGGDGGSGGNGGSDGGSDGGGGNGDGNGGTDDDNDGGSGGDGDGSGTDNDNGGEVSMPLCAACGGAGVPFAPFIALGIGGMKLRRRR